MYILQVNGDSMNKILANGSYIIVHDYRINQDYKLNSNDILVLRLVENTRLNV